MKSISTFILLTLAVLLAALLVWLLPDAPSRHYPAFVLLWLLPALAWFFWLPGSRLQRFLSGAGLGFLSVILLTLLIHISPGPIARWHLLIAAIVASLGLPLLLYPVRDWEPHALPRPPWRRATSTNRNFLFLFALLVALVLLTRLPQLGYKELQGDEGLIMERAAASLLGDDQALFLHQKGPAEILIPLASWGLTGATTETWLRLPFAWAGILAVLALYALARPITGRWPALLAAFLFAVGGFGIAFSRIVQYQSLVMLWTILALSHAFLYRRHGRPLHLILSAAFVAAGLLAHYDALMVVPAVAWLLLQRIVEQRVLPWKAATGALLLATFILGLFYIPFAASPTFADTGSYLLSDRLGGNLLSWSGAEVWRMVTFYNSIYYVAGLALLTLTALVLARRQDGFAALAIYAFVPLVFYTAIVADPRTHVYTFFPGLALLAALGAQALWQRTNAPALRKAGVALLALFLVISLAYVALLFLDTSVERQRNWSQAQPALYPTTWTEPPLYGLFGFPYQAGWRAVPGLVEDLPYASNEEQEVTGWYMAQATRTHCADYATFIMAANVQDPVPTPPGAPDDLHLHHTITVNGRSTIQIYGRQPAAPTEVEATGIQLWRTPEQVVPPRPNPQHDLQVQLGDRVRLLGYDIDTSRLQPDGELLIVLYWEPLVPFERNFQTFVHLYDGTLYAQHDSAPDCAIYPTSHWEPGRIVRDPHIVQLPADIPSDTPIPVLAGMYDLLSYERLTTTDSGADTILLTEIEVPAP